MKAEYDFGTTTYFTIRAVQKENLSQEEAALCPRQESSTSQDTTAAMEIYRPEGTPSLNDLFPHGNSLLFGDIAQWIILFHPGNCYAAVEAGPNAMGDMVFCPLPFVSVEETLLSLDAAGTKQPKEDCRPDAYSRMVFPPIMGSEDEENYLLYKKERDELDQAVARSGGAVTLDQMAAAG